MISVEQAQQDAITLDYGKWSAQRRQAKLPADHNLWQQERDKVLARQRADNEAARARYFDSLEENRKAEAREAAEKLDAELASEKKRIQNEWLANHPGETPADFEKKAWHLIRENLVAERSQKVMETELEAARATGRYSL